VNQRRVRSDAETRNYYGRVGMAALAVASLLLYLAFLHDIPFFGGPSGTIVRAEVRTAANVSSRTPVRVGGTDVGKVEKIVSAGGGRASTLEMRITSPGVRVRNDATAQVRYRTLLGGSMYIDLQPGSKSAPPLGGHTIPLARTSAQVDWDEFNSVWAKPVPRAQQWLIKGFADGIKDPAALREVLRQSGPALASFGRAARASRGQREGELPSLIRRAAATMRGFASDGKGLEAAIRGAQETTAATASVRQSLGDTITTAAPALRSTRVTMARLDRTLTHADPLVEELRPAARATAPATKRLRPALTGLNRLLVDARPLLRHGPPTLATLRTTVREGVPFLDVLKKFNVRFNGEVLPWLRSYDPRSRLKVQEMVGPWLSGQNDSYAGFDDNGYFLRAVGQPAPDSPVIPCSVGLPPQPIETCPLLRQVMAMATRGKR
jgi:ABC-type transporter Mla subunit MlaD